MTDVHRYRSDDRDLDGHDNDLMVYQGENGDWYLTIVPHGHKIGPTVRITTSGAPATQPYAARGVRELWQKLDIGWWWEAPCGCIADPHGTRGAGCHVIPSLPSHEVSEHYATVRAAWRSDTGSEA